MEETIILKKEIISVIGILGRDTRKHQNRPPSAVGFLNREQPSPEKSSIRILPDFFASIHNRLRFANEEH